MIYGVFLLGLTRKRQKIFQICFFFCCNPVMMDPELNTKPMGFSNWFYLEKGNGIFLILYSTKPIGSALNFKTEKYWCFFLINLKFCSCRLTRIGNINSQCSIIQNKKNCFKQNKQTLPLNLLKNIKKLYLDSMFSHLWYKKYPLITQQNKRIIIATSLFFVIIKKNN